MNAHVPLLDPTVRRSVEDEIERLLALLDGLDPDPDLEPDLDGEPGTWTEVMNSRGYRETDDENLEEGADLEATALENAGRGFRYSGPDDSEDNGDHEPDEEDEGAQCDDEGVIDGDSDTIQ